MPHLERESGIFILHLDNQDGSDVENRFSPRWLEEAISCIDEAEAGTGPTALITTGAGKFYSNGFIPERFGGDPESVQNYLLSGQALFARILSSELPTLAAIQGHAFAGGAILAMAHDRRVMRTDRGYFCLPEINLGLPLPGGMSDLLQSRLTPATCHEAMLTGRRYGGPEALAAGIVDEVTAENDLMPAALAWAAATSPTRGATLAGMKRHLYRHVLSSLSRLEAR